MSARKGSEAEHGGNSDPSTALAGEDVGEDGRNVEQPFEHGREAASWTDSGGAAAGAEQSKHVPSPALPSLEARLIALETAQERTNTELRTSNRKVLALEAQLRTSNRKVLALEAQLYTSNRKVLALEAQLYTSSRKVLALEAQLYTSSRKVLALEAQLYTSNRKVLALEAQLYTSNRKVLALEAAEGRVKGQIWSLAKSVAHLQVSKRLGDSMLCAVDVSRGIVAATAVSYEISKMVLPEDACSQVNRVARATAYALAHLPTRFADKSSFESMVQATVTGVQVHMRNLLKAAQAQSGRFSSSDGHRQNVESAVDPVSILQDCAATAADTYLGLSEERERILDVVDSATAALTAANEMAQADATIFSPHEQGEGSRLAERDHWGRIATALETTMQDMNNERVCGGTKVLIARMIYGLLTHASNASDLDAEEDDLDAEEGAAEAGMDAGAEKERGQESGKSAEGERVGGGGRPGSAARTRSWAEVARGHVSRAGTVPPLPTVGNSTGHRPPAHSTQQSASRRPPPRELPHLPGTRRDPRTGRVVLNVSAATWRLIVHAAAQMTILCKPRNKLVHLVAELADTELSYGARLMAHIAARSYPGTAAPSWTQFKTLCRFLVPSDASVGRTPLGV